jgi:dolichyl-phosphate beta-glucosyltransferase
MTSLSIIIPLYNEELSIPALIGELQALRVQGLFDRLEPVFINDGSTDGTEEVLRAQAGSLEGSVVLSYPINRGKGCAVRTGMLAASGEWRLVVDADLSVPLQDIRCMLPAMEKQCAIIIGSRNLPGSSILVPQRFFRCIIGKGFSRIANAVLRLGISDISCGFKCFSAPAAGALFTQSKIDRWAYDAEILYLAKIRNLKVCEVAIRWINRPESRVRLLPAIAGSLRDLARIRLLHRRAPHAI